MQAVSLLDNGFISRCMHDCKGDEYLISYRHHHSYYRTRIRNQINNPYITLKPFSFDLVLVLSLARVFVSSGAANDTYDTRLNPPPAGEPRSLLRLATDSLASKQTSKQSEAYRRRGSLLSLFSFFSFPFFHSSSHLCLFISGLPSLAWLGLAQCVTPLAQSFSRESLAFAFLPTFRFWLYRRNGMCLGMWIFAFRIGCLHVWDLILVLLLVLGGGRINTFFFSLVWYVIFYGILVRTRGNGLWRY